MNSERRAAPARLPAIGLVLLMLSGCGYGEVSPATYEYAKALYSVSNRQSADRLDAVLAQIDTAAESGELPEHEADWLRDIVTQCRAGHWKAAQAAARQIMQDQVK